MGCRWSLLSLSLLFLLHLSSCSHSNTFLVLGDWGSAGIPIYAPTQQSVANAMGKVAEKLKPEFIISTGDNFYDSGVQSTKDPLWKDAWSSMYSASALQVPWYIALGNHDWMGSLDAQLQFDDDNWNLPDNFYTVNIHHMNLTLVVIDTTPLINMYWNTPENGNMAAQLPKAKTPKDQYSWLESTLAKASNESRWIIVVGHHQMYSAHGNGTIGESGFAELQLGVQPLLSKYGAHMYLCGHVHNLQHIEAFGVHHFISGAGSRLELAKRSDDVSSKFWAEKPGFMSVSVDYNYLTAAFYDNSATVIYTMQVDHNETLTIPDNSILGLPASTIYIIAFCGTFALIGLAGAGYYCYKRYKSTRRKEISLPLEDPTDDTDTLV